ncbi:MAG TPA: ABC transporter ATP-binding protein [Vicinamibacterales bacterium]
MSAAILVENLSKRYRLGHRERYRALRDTLADALRAPVRRFRRLTNTGTTGESGGPEHIWALRDVSFEVAAGEVIGIVGRNGAGKSTLLKILSRITAPTEGHVTIRGLVGSLLEVGTGFHPELTGRENVFLNGAILGMKRRDIERRFDEIVAFAEVERFVDTPVKHYSSGMQMRLAFAVAAHLDPEVLIVDEVLAVGDAAFQQKCLGKVGEVTRSGRTVLLVSHQMNQIRRLCHRVVWLEAGQIRDIGATAGVVSAYENALSTLRLEAEARGDDTTAARFVSWEVVEPRGESAHTIGADGPVTIRVRVRVNRPVSGGFHGILLYNQAFQIMWSTNLYNLRLEPGLWDFVHTLPSLPLQPGRYAWRLSIFDEHGIVDEWMASPELLIATTPVSHPDDAWQGILNLPTDFRVQPVSESPRTATLAPISQV